MTYIGDRQTETGRQTDRQTNTYTYIDLLYWGFTSYQNLESYHDEYRLMTVCSHGDLIVLSPWEMRLAALWLDIPSQPLIMNYPCPILEILSTMLYSDKYQCCKSLIWLAWDSKPGPPSRSFSIRMQYPCSSHTILTYWDKPVRCVLVMPSDTIQVS